MAGAAAHHELIWLELSSPRDGYEGCLLLSPMLLCDLTLQSRGQAKWCYNIQISMVLLLTIQVIRVSAAAHQMYPVYCKSETEVKSKSYVLVLFAKTKTKNRKKPR